MNATEAHTHLSLPLPSYSFAVAPVASHALSLGCSPCSSLILGMHLSFAGLVLVLLALYVLSAWNIHVLALTAVSLCLWISTGWSVNRLPFPFLFLHSHVLTRLIWFARTRFVMELLKVQKQQEEEKRLAAATGIALGEKGKGTETVDLSKEGKKDR